MTLLASAALFEQAGGLYWNPATNEGYRQYPFFQDRIDNLKQRFAPNNQKTAIYGCGWGYLVQLAVAAGYDAFGFDASAYAINKAKALFPALATRFFVRNATVSADVTASKNDAGLKGNARFSILMTEDMLTCLTDQEITTCLPLLRGVCGNNLLHLVTLLDTSTVQDVQCNWKTAAQWKAIISPPDFGIDDKLVQFAP